MPGPQEGLHVADCRKWDPRPVQGEEQHRMWDAIKGILYVHSQQVAVSLELLGPADGSGLGEGGEGQLPAGEFAQGRRLLEDEPVESHKQGFLHCNRPPLAALLRDKLEPELRQGPEFSPVPRPVQLPKGVRKEVGGAPPFAQVQEVLPPEARRPRGDGPHGPELTEKGLACDTGGRPDNRLNSGEDDLGGLGVELPDYPGPLHPRRLWDVRVRGRLALDRLPRPPKEPLSEEHVRGREPSAPLHHPADAQQAGQRLRGGKLTGQHPERGDKQVEQGLRGRAARDADDLRQDVVERRVVPKPVHMGVEAPPCLVLRPAHRAGEGIRWIRRWVGGVGVWTRQGIVGHVVDGAVELDVAIYGIRVQQLLAADVAEDRAMQRRAVVRGPGVRRGQPRIGGRGRVLATAARGWPRGRQRGGAGVPPGRALVPGGGVGTCAHPFFGAL